MLPDYQLLASVNLDETGFIVVVLLVAASVIPAAKAFDSYVAGLLCTPFLVTGGLAVHIGAGHLGLGLGSDFVDGYFERYANLAITTGVGMSLVFLAIVGLVQVCQAAQDKTASRTVRTSTKESVSALRKTV